MLLGGFSDERAIHLILKPCKHPYQCVPKRQQAKSQDRLRGKDYKSRVLLLVTWFACFLLLSLCFFGFLLFGPISMFLCCFVLVFLLYFIMCHLIVRWTVVRAWRRRNEDGLTCLRLMKLNPSWIELWTCGVSSRTTCPHVITMLGYLLRGSLQHIYLRFYWPWYYNFYC